MKELLMIILKVTKCLGTDMVELFKGDFTFCQNVKSPLNFGKFEILLFDFYHYCFTLCLRSPKMPNFCKITRKRISEHRDMY